MAAAGAEVGDIIVSINGQSVDGELSANLRSLLVGPRGATRVFGLRDGRSLEVVAK